ncbi:MAG: hypothetical protein GY703_13485 [Gammaproteobacteria bacterium]|nr:hypothetical protein [Gammaproteobacteria bacterium]
MKYTTPKIVQPGSQRVWPWVVLVILLIAGVGWYAFEFGRERQGGSLAVLEDRITQQRVQIESLEEERESLLEKMTALEQAENISREAMGQVRKDLAVYQKERAGLEEELTLLRSMVSDTDGPAVIRIQQFKLVRAKEARTYRYRFAITQTNNKKEVATGSIFIALDGLRDGQPHWLPLRDITEDNVERLKMRFKHFQDVEGLIRLPENFEPKKLIVEIKPNGNKLAPVKQLFDWAVASRGNS